MQPGLKIQDRLLVDKITYKTRPPQRGEIVVFNSPYAFDPALKSPQEPSPFLCGLVNLPLVGLIPGLGDHACDAYIKRVVGLPGETIWLVDGDVFAKADGETEFIIQRKPEHVQRAVWQEVWNSNSVPVAPEQRARRWPGPPWKATPASAWSMDE